MKPSYALTLLLAISLSGCFSGTSKPDTFVETSADDEEMEAAIARARSEVDTFLAELEKPTGTDHSVKAPITDKDQTEHFWLTGITFANDQFEGTIGNEPGMVSNVKFGQKWTVKKSDISDWMYMRDGKIHGNYTMRPLLKSMPEDEAAEFRKMLAEP
jgi:uncharacterized protein YegJ (DUF2314 family)